MVKNEWRNGILDSEFKKRKELGLDGTNHGIKDLDSMKGGV